MDAVVAHWSHVFFEREHGAETADESGEEASEDGAPLSDAESGEQKQQQVAVVVQDDEVVVESLEPAKQDLDAVSQISDARTQRRTTKIMTMREKQLVGLMGPDAVQYLRFQKYIIIYIFLTTLISCTVILPLNLQGSKLGGNYSDFGHTTLANLDPQSNHDSVILWIHVCLAFLMFPLAIFLMRRFSIGLKMTDTNLKITRTIAIENIPQKLCRNDLIREHLAEAYPECEISDIQVVYDVTRLIHLTQRLENVVDSRKFCKKWRVRQKAELEMVPVSCSRCCNCFCLPCIGKVNCEEHFCQEEVRLRAKITEEETEARKVTLGMAFVTFQSINNARLVLRDHKNSMLHFKQTARESKFAMNPQGWKVWYAPPPSDIIWENLSNKRWTLIKKIFANVFIFIVAFFLTTPQFIVHQLDPILNALKNISAEQQPAGNSSDSEILVHIRYLPVWITDFLPTLMLWTFTALLPVVIAWADLLVGHWTRSGQNHAIMKKTFWYLLFMVIILPTFGFTSTQAYIDFLLKNQNLNWECIFLPDSGAFFVNYVITSALLGSALELIRFPELFWYLVQICISRSKADTPAIRKAIKYEFRFGEQYARMMLIFAMVVMFSIVCPLITPFGCLYFLFKHAVDRHNLAFVYARSKINKKVHASAINFVIMSVALLQFFIILFSYIRSRELASIGELDIRTKVSLFLFIVTVNISSAQIWSNTCRRISPVKYEDVQLAEPGRPDEHSLPYLPSVLLASNTISKESTTV